MSFSTKKAAPSCTEPPDAPPLPPPKTAAEKQKSFPLKISRRASNSHGCARSGKVERALPDPLSAAAAGTYFLYGTLRDPAMLMDILDLPSPPILRPAYIVGYARRLWGQYPALVDAPSPGAAVVEGSAFEVPNPEAAEKLADYETTNYTTAPCLVHLADGESSTSTIYGYTFVFAGRKDDLTDGDFDLDQWLKNMGRERP